MSQSAIIALNTFRVCLSNYVVILLTYRDKT
ncbi:hypothetical protein EZS27_032363, partial [termite gut metagenome]